MSTTQQTRLYSPVAENQITNTWSSVFIDEFSTVNHSTTFVKQLLAVALSCITYLRSFFTEAAYGDKIINGLNVKLLLSDCRCIGPNTFVQNIVACFDAIEKQYLKELKFIVYEHDPDYPLEVYTFNFTYNENGSASMFKLKGRSNQGGETFNIKLPTMKMLRSIILLIQSFDQPPDTVFFGFKLFYYEDVTPSDYEPLGFMPVIHHETKFPSNSARIKAGKVRTMFHEVKLSVDTVCCRSLGNIVHGPNTQTKLQVSLNNNHHTASDFIDDEQENPLPPSPEPAVCRSLRASGMKKMVKKQTLSVKLYGKNMSSTVKTAKHKRDRNAAYSPRRISLHSGPGYNNLNSRDGSTQSLLNKTSMRQSYTHSPFITESSIRCPCGVYIEDGPMVTCTICSFRQHAVCFKLLEEKDLQLRHVCEICANLTHSCTDSSLTSTDVIQVRETCLFRRLLVHLRNNENYHTPASLAQLLHVTTHVGKRLMVRLQSEGALASEPSNDPRGRLVDQKMLLQYVIPHMFHKDELPNYQRYTSSLQIIRELVSEENQNRDVQFSVTSSDIQENVILKCDRLRSVTNGTLKEDPHNNAHQNHTLHCSKQNGAQHGADKSHPMTLGRRRNCQHQLGQELKIQNFHSKKRYTSPQVNRELVSEKDQSSDVQLNITLSDIQDNVNLNCDKIGSVTNEILEEDPHNSAQQNHTIHCCKQTDTLHGDDSSHPMILRPRNTYKHHLGQELEIQNIQSKKMYASSLQIIRELVNEEDQNSDVQLNVTSSDIQENFDLKCDRLRSVVNGTHLQQNDTIHGGENSHPMILRPRRNCRHQLGEEFEIQNTHSKKIYTSSLQISREFVNEEDQNSYVQLNVTSSDIQENVDLKCDRLRNVVNGTHLQQNDAVNCGENSHPMILRPRRNCKHQLGQELKIQNVHSKKIYTSSLQISRELVSEKDQNGDVQMNVTLRDIEENFNFKCEKIRSVAKETHEEDPHNKAHQYHTVHCSKQNDALHGADNSHPMILRPRGNCQHQFGKELEIQTIHSKKMYTSSLQIIRERVNEEYQKSDLQMTVTLTDIPKNGDLKCDKLRSVANSTNKEDPHLNAHQNYTAHCSKQNKDLHHAENSYPMILRPRQNYEQHLGQALEIQNKRVCQSAQRKPKRRKV